MLLCCCFSGFGKVAVIVLFCTPVQSCSVFFSPVQSCSVLVSPVQSCSVLFSSVQSCSVMFSPSAAFSERFIRSCYSTPLLTYSFAQELLKKEEKSVSILSYTAESSHNGLNMTCKAYNQKIHYDYVEDSVPIVVHCEYFHQGWFRSVGRKGSCPTLF